MNTEPVEIEYLVRNNTAAGMKAVQSGADDVTKAAEQAKKRIRDLEAQIIALQKTMARNPQMDQTQNIRQIEALQREIQQLQTAAKKVDLTPPNAPAVQRTYNGLAMSIQQVARELPSLAMGPQMFFLAISNNLPILSDQIAVARKEYQALVQAGQKATPVWRQVLSSILSWQTALVVGITLLVTYGKEISQWVGTLFKGKQALDTARFAADQFHAALARGTVDAQKEITRLKLLYEAATDAARPYEERRQAVEKLQQAYPAYFGNMDAERIMAGKLKQTYDHLRDAIIQTARARAALDLITENESSIIKIENTPQYAKINALNRAMKQNRKKIEDLLAKGISKKSPLIRGVEGVIEAQEDAVARLSKSIAKALELPDEAREDIIAYLEALKAANESLAKQAETLFTTKSPDEKNGEATKSKSRIKVEDIQEQYRTAVLKQQQDLDQALVEQMEQGAQKQREQIRLDYEKKRQLYEEQERSILNLIRKLRASGATLSPQAEQEVMATTSASIAAAAKERDRKLDEVDAKEAKAYEKLLQKYETYQQGRLRLAEKYDKDIRHLNESMSASRLEVLGKQMTDDFAGNVELRARPMIDAAKLVEKGWKDAGEGIATVFSSQFGVEDAAGRVHEILITPILPDGSVLSESQLEEYIDTALQGADDILAADSRGLVIAVDVDPDGSAGEKLHQLQEEYYDLRQKIREGDTSDAEAAMAIQTANEAKQKALDEFDVTFASQFPQFEAWANRIITASVGKLEELLALAQDELEELQAEDSKDDDAVAVARAKVVKLQQLLQKRRAEESEAPGDKSLKQWQDLLEMLHDVGNEFEQIGNQVGGTGGEILQLAGQVSSSIITMIGGIQTMANAAALSISKVEKASVILTIIAAAVQVITAIAGLFKDQETSLERNLRLAREFNEELRIMKQRAKIDAKDYDSIFGDRIYARYKQNVEMVRESLEAMQQVQERIRNRGQETYTEFGTTSETGLANLNLMAKTWESAAESVANMQVQTRHSTWFRSAKYKSLGSLLPELFDGGQINMEALKKFVEDGGDNFKHLSKQNQEMLRDMVDNWELYEEAVQAVNEYMQGIFGELGNTLTDALVDAFENGSDAAEAFVDSTGQALRKLAKDMVYSMTLGKVFEEAQKSVDEINRSDMSDEERFSALSEVMRKLVEDGVAQQQDFNRLWEEFRRMAEQQGLSIDDPTAGGTSQSGKAGAIEAVTQESFSRVEGLVTSIQIHAANMDEAMEQGIVPTLGRSLDELIQIRYNTNVLPQIHALLMRIDRDGLKVK